MRGGRNHRVVLIVLLALVAACPAVLVGPGAPPAWAAGPAAGTVASLAFSPSPPAPPGSLAPGQAVDVTLAALDPAGAAVNDGLVYLSLTSTAAAPGTASVAGVALTSTPQPFTTSQNGLVAIAYAAAAPQCSAGGVCVPAAFPTSGSDQIQATAGPSGPGSITAQDSYSYAPAGVESNPDRYSFSPDPPAGPGSLQAGQSVPVTLTVTQSSGAPEPGASVFVSLTTTASDGAGLSATGGQCSNGQIASAPVSCTTDANGQLSLDYTVANPGPGSSLPSTGEDAMTVQNRAAAPTETATDTYQYGVPSYQLSSNPMAPTGSLGANQSETLSITVTGPDGKAVADCPVYLLLAAAKDTSAAGGAVATGAVPSDQNPTGAPTLGTSPVPFDTDSNGVVLVTYSTPPDPPASGMDVLVAQDRATSASVTGFDPYSFSAPEFSFSPDLLAPGASLGAGQSVAIALSVSSSAPAAYLSMDQAEGGGSASVGGVALSATPTAFSPGPGGRLSVTYRAPSRLPKSGTDRIIVQDAPSGPAGAASDTYSFSPGPAAGAGSGGGSVSGNGYWLVAADGGVFSFGDARFYGSTGAIHLAAPVVGMAATPDGAGYWLVAADGGVFSFGDARFEGSTGAIHLAAPVVGMAATPDGAGYWLVASDGGVFSFGDARFEGSEGGAHLPGSIVGMAAAPDGGGYWLAGADGSVYSFGDAPARGGAAGGGLVAPVVGIAPTATGLGYWLVAADGGVFSFGDAAWYGSTGAERLTSPVRAMSVTTNAAGYWLVAGDGGVFAFGNAPFAGSEGGKPLNSPVVGATTT